MKATGRVNGSKASRTAGFSFLEVVVVLVILAVLAIVVMPRIGNTPAELKAEADMLRAHLRFIQTMAMANNTCTWGIALAGGGYSMTRMALRHPSICRERIRRPTPCRLVSASCKGWVRTRSASGDALANH